MKYIEFTHEDKTYALSFTAEALFTVYDKFGVTGDILGTTKILEPTAEGWKNLCWIAALMATQGELQRRNLGHNHHPMVTMEELRTGLMAAEAPRLKQAVIDALEQGFHRDIPDEEEEEINLVLQEREEAEKKAKARVSAALTSWLERLTGSITRQETPSC